MQDVRETVGQRITAEMKRNKMLMRALARVIQVAQPTVYKWCHDQSETLLRHIRALAAVFNVSPLWLMYGDDVPSVTETVTSGNVSVGNGGIIYRSNDDILYYPVPSDEMEPTVRLGDVAIVDRSVSRIGPSGIYLVVLGGEDVMRRFSRTIDGSLKVNRDNAERYPDIEIICGQDIRNLTVVGKVVSKVSVSKLS